jgi:hypothetical protein
MEGSWALAGQDTWPGQLRLGAVRPGRMCARAAPDALRVLRSSSRSEKSVSGTAVACVGVAGMGQSVRRALWAATGSSGRIAVQGCCTTSN